jgi:hypothetical protein
VGRGKAGAVTDGYRPIAGLMMLNDHPLVVNDPHLVSFS